MEWAEQRKIVYALGFAGIVILLAAYPVYNLVKKPSTCFDKKQNGTETGVDCGGTCSLVCISEVKAPRIVWAKAFPINGDTYDLGAYLENTNANAGIKNVHYTLRVIGSNEKVLVERKGSTELAPSSAILLFETGVTFPGVANRVEVSFDSADLAMWTRASTASSVILTKNKSLINADTKPRFDAVLVNTDPVNDVKNLTLGAIIYDTARNPVAVSRTYVNTIPKSGEQNIFFTWPNRFTTHGRGEMCTDSTVTTTSIATSSVSAVSQSPCPLENFITEIVVTPSAIFVE